MEKDERKQMETFDNFINGENGKELLQLIKEFLQSRTQAVKNAKWEFISDRTYYLLLVAACLVTIIYLALQNLIDKTVTGTLLGSVIGYSLAKVRKKDDD